MCRQLQFWRQLFFFSILICSVNQVISSDVLDVIHVLVKRSPLELFGRFRFDVLPCYACRHARD